MRHCLCQFVLLSYLLIDSVHARTWYVTPNGTGQAPTIQAAVDSSTDGDEVVLAPGIYTWTSQAASGSSMVTIMKSITLRGETDAEGTILDAEGNSARVITAVGFIEISRLTVTGGNPTFGVTGGGVGMSRGNISHCIIRNNRTNSYGYGAGLVVGDGTVTHCQVLDNQAGPDAGGGGIYIERGVVSSTLVRGNSVRGDPGGYGGGIYAQDSEIADCWIEGNRARGPFGGVGGGLYASGRSGVTITRCTFVGNSAESALSSARGGAIATTDLHPVAITECVFIGNRATNSYSGAIFSSHAGVQISYCTLVGNETGIDNGTVRNSIIAWTNGPACDSMVRVSCSLLFSNGQPGSTCGIDGGGNIQVDPQFCAVDPRATRNVFLQSDSPCVDAPSCGRIGAAPVGCEAVSIESLPWSGVKAIYRR